MKAEQYIYGDKLVTIYSMDEQEEKLYAEQNKALLPDELLSNVEVMQSAKKRYHSKSRRKAERSETKLFKNKTPLLSRLHVYKKALDGCITIGNTNLFDKIPLRKKMEGTAPDCGLIIGDLPSQLFSNLYLNGYDHFVKRELKCDCYGRYVDDSFLMSTDQEYLNDCKYKIAGYLKDELGLELNFAKTKIKSTKRDLTFLGADMRDRRRYTLNRTLKHFKNEALAIRDTIASGEPMSPTDATSCLSILNSYLGYLNHFRTYKSIKTIIDSASELSEVFVFTKNYEAASLKKEFHQQPK